MSESEDLHQRLIDESHKHQLSLLATHKKNCAEGFTWLADRIEENRAAQCERGERLKSQMELLAETAKLGQQTYLAGIANEVESLSYAIMAAETMDQARDVVREALKKLRRLVALAQIPLANQEKAAG